MLAEVPQLLNQNAGTLALILAGIAGAWKGVPKLLELLFLNSSKFQDRLIGRIEKLEQAIEEERNTCDKKLSRMQGRMDFLNNIVLTHLTGKPLSAELNGSFSFTETIPEDMAETVSKAV